MKRVPESFTENLMDDIPSIDCIVMPLNMRSTIPISGIVSWSEIYRGDASIDPKIRKKFRTIHDM